MEEIKNSCLIILVMISLVSVSCAQQSEVKEYPGTIGDIQYDPVTDDPGFKVCNTEQIVQYYSFGKGMQFKGEKFAIEEYFRTKFKSPVIKDVKGYITIRFVVNCEGATGRFRVEEMDENFQPATFPKALSRTLLNLTVNLSGWMPGTYEEQTYDYYQHLIFKIKDGQINEILP